jgi:ketosteroid isomerase-like protein
MHDVEPTARAELTELMTDWNAAIVANDAHAIGAFAEPDWVFVGENGIFPGVQFLESVATGHVSHDMMTTDIHDARVYGDVAVLIARVRNRGEFGGDAFTLDEWSTDVFVRRGGRWRCVLTQLTPAAPDPSSDSHG